MPFIPSQILLRISLIEEKTLKPSLMPFAFDLIPSLKSINLLRKSANLLAILSITERNPSNLGTLIFNLFAKFEKTYIIILDLFSAVKNTF